MIVGYKLIEDATDSVVKQWGGDWGSCPGVPDRLDLPGDVPTQVHAPQINTSYSGYTLAAWELDAPTDPNAYPLQRYQFMAMLTIAGLAGAVETAVNTLTDPVQKAVAQAKYDSTQVFQRDDPLLNQLAAAAGLTAAQVDAYWMQAKGL